MDCNYIKNNLFAIAEKRLNEADLVRVTEHVSRCSSCAGTLESFSLFVDANIHAIEVFRCGLRICD